MLISVPDKQLLSQRVLSQFWGCFILFIHLFKLWTFVPLCCLFAVEISKTNNQPCQVFSSPPCLICPSPAVSCSYQLPCWHLQPLIKARCELTEEPHSSTFPLAAAFFPADRDMQSSFCDCFGSHFIILSSLHHHLLYWFFHLVYFPLFPSFFLSIVISFLQCLFPPVFLFLS